MLIIQHKMNVTDMLHSFYDMISIKICYDICVYEALKSHYIVFQFSGK